MTEPSIIIRALLGGKEPGLRKEHGQRESSKDVPLVTWKDEMWYIMIMEYYNAIKKWSIKQWKGETLSEYHQMKSTNLARPHSGSPIAHCEPGSGYYSCDVKKSLTVWLHPLKAIRSVMSRAWQVKEGMSEVCGFMGREITVSGALIHDIVCFFSFNFFIWYLYRHFSLLLINIVCQSFFLTLIWILTLNVELQQSIYIYLLTSSTLYSTRVWI